MLKSTFDLINKIQAAVPGAKVTIQGDEKRLAIKASFGDRVSVNVAYYKGELLAASPAAQDAQIDKIVEFCKSCLS